MSEGIGVSVRRKEDKKFLTGKGRYTDDISRPGQVHAFFVRSDVAHANIKSINIKSAKEAEGVVAVTRRMLRRASRSWTQTSTTRSCSSSRRCSTSSTAVLRG